MRTRARWQTARVTRHDGLVVWRRRVHLVVWDDEHRVTVPCWPVYWSDARECSFVRVREVPNERAYIPLAALVGYWDWFAGDVRGYRVLDGFGPCGLCMPKRDVIRKVPWVGGGGAYLWLAQSVMLPPDPMAHT